MKKNASIRFSVFQSTEQQNRSTDTQFYGAFAHLRKKLDYNYQSHYVKERQWLQDSIIEDMLDNEAETKVQCVTPTEPWLVYTVGAQGAGKHFTIQQLVQHGRLPLLSFVAVDPDEIRRRLPEFSTYVEKCPELVDAFTNKECGYISEILTLAALQAGRNVVLDGALQDGDWHAHFFDSLRHDFPDVKIGMIHVVAPQDLILQRASVSNTYTVFIAVSSWSWPSAI
jgi:predicted kinase